MNPGRGDGGREWGRGDGGEREKEQKEVFPWQLTIKFSKRSIQITLQYTVNVPKGSF